MSMTMTGRRSPGALKRTTFTKDIKQSDKSSGNGSNNDKFVANTSSIMKKYSINPSGMRSP